MDSTRRMALLDLQKELSKEIETILEDMMLKAIFSGINTN